MDAGARRGPHPLALAYLTFFILLIVAGAGITFFGNPHAGESVVSIALSEEFTLTTAELSYLQDRKVAYENLAKRTGLEGVKSVCLALMPRPPMTMAMRG